MSVHVALAAFPHRVTEELMCIGLVPDDDIDSDTDHCYYHVLYGKSSGEIGMVTKLSLSFCTCHVQNVFWNFIFYTRLGCLYAGSVSNHADYCH